MSFTPSVAESSYDKSKKNYDVVHKGEAGQLTLTRKEFHFKRNDGTTLIKCSWVRVEQRLLSPPGASTPLLKLVLVSGRTTLFEVASEQLLLELLKDVKMRMEAVTPLEQTTKKQARDRGTRAVQRKGYASDYAEQARPPEELCASDNKRKQQYNDSNGSQLQSRSGQDDSWTRAQHDKDRDDDSRHATGCIPWESIWCWLCLALFLAIIALIITLIVLFGINDDNKESDSSSAPALCRDAAPDVSKCPPDDGLEGLYGIRSVNYVWDPTFVRLEYFVSDYILTESVEFTVMDGGVDCRDAPKTVPKDNPWLDFELKDGTAMDGGSNLYNLGRGTRQFDIYVRPIAGSDVTQAPFYSTNNPANDKNNKGILQICVVFQIFYNKIQNFAETVEVNSIENALELNVDISDPANATIHDVQTKTVTQPEHI